jgi:hypothetical protein
MESNAARCDCEKRTPRWYISGRRMQLCRDSLVGERGFWYFAGGAIAAGLIENGREGSLPDEFCYGARGGLALLSKGRHRAIDGADRTAQSLSDPLGLDTTRPLQDGLTAAEFDLMVRLGTAPLETLSRTARQIDAARNRARSHSVLAF